MPKVFYLLVPLLIAAAAMAYLYARFRQKPAAQWSLRVKRRAAELRERLDLLIHPRGDSRTAAERLADELFDKQKRDTSVQALSRYAKIGPKTVEWLTDAGVRTVADAEKHANAFMLFKKKIDNVGEAREEAIAAATKQCLIDERASFDAGRTAAGQEYASRLAHLSAAEREQANAKARERTAIEECLGRMGELETLASRVTFVNSLTGQLPVLDDAMLTRELPVVEIAPAPLPASASTPSPPSSPPPPAAMNPALAHLQACCRFALLAAKADGRIAQTERARIRAHLGDQFGHDPLLLRHLDPQLEQAEANLPEERDAWQTIKSLTPKSEWTALYTLAQEVIDSGGERSPKETQFLARLAEAFELEAAATTMPVVAEAPVPLPPEEPLAGPDPLEVLGIPAKTTITAELVRRRHRMLTDQYDPEKAKLLGPEFQAMAEAKRIAVQAAAEALMASLGEPLAAPAPPPPKDMRHNPELDDLFG